MASERETVADICKRARKELDKSWWEIDREFVRDLPTTMLKAHDREMADALDTGAFVEAARKREVAPLREALEKVSKTLKAIHDALSENESDCWRWRYVRAWAHNDAESCRDALKGGNDGD